MDLDVLAFGAHPDDVELTCGGTLVRLQAQGRRTGVIALTRGELGTRGDPAARAEEFSAAAAVMGLAYHGTLGIPDGHISARREYKLQVVRQIRELRPRLVVAPYWKDRHPDHENASILVREAAFLSGLAKVETGQLPHRPYRVLFYPSRYEFRPSFVVDVSGFHERKLEAILCYKSQFHNPGSAAYGSEVTNVSRPEFLEYIVARARQYGSYIGTRFGEPFLVREPLRLDDPVALFGPECLQSFV